MHEPPGLGRMDERRGREYGERIQREVLQGLFQWRIFYISPASDTRVFCLRHWPLSKAISMRVERNIISTVRYTFPEHESILLLSRSLCLGDNQHIYCFKNA